ncbi:hypothetical protein A5CBH24_12930 [Alistipes communis]|uniref:Uncharacterized protein n=1 Tax=Alistipes communis TaxID=2585118 RepID=A0A4Y1WSE4_9BACT|nr:hypothetical protein A5CBH24_12930 [Alistipes communis]BBL13373.1 hypothetical protein A6CPBBH3_00120 [Alistipes communis]
MRFGQVHTPVPAGIVRAAGCGRRFRIVPDGSPDGFPAEEPDRAGGQNQTTASAVALCEISP